MAEMTFTAMSRDDIAEVRVLDAACFSDPWSVAAWERELEGRGRRHLVARLDGQVVGHAGTLTMIDELHITVVAVDPTFEGRGLATRLCLDLLEQGRSQGATAATLEVRAQSRRAQRLYGRLGFVPSGIRPGYYRQPTDDAVIMWLADLDGAEAEARLRAVAAEVALTEGAMK